MQVSSMMAQKKIRPFTISQGPSTSPHN